MGLSGEVEHGVVTRQHLVEQRGVEDVAVDEGVARAVGDRREVGEVAGVGELVETVTDAPAYAG